MWKSTALRTSVPYEATQKPEVEGQERKEHESPPVALHTEEHGDEEDPRREKGAHDDRLFDVLTRPGVDPAAVLFVCRHFGTTIVSQCQRLKRHGSRRRLPLAAASSFASTSISRTSAFVEAYSHVCDSLGDQAGEELVLEDQVGYGQFRSPKAERSTGDGSRRRSG